MPNQIDLRPDLYQRQLTHDPLRRNTIDPRAYVQSPFEVTQEILLGSLKKLLADLKDMLDIDLENMGGIGKLIENLQKVVDNLQVSLNKLEILFTNKLLSGANLVVNPSFSDTTLPLTVYGEPVSYEFTTERKHSGATSFKWVHNGDGLDGLWFMFGPDGETSLAVLPGDKYFVQLWVLLHPNNTRNGGAYFGALLGDSTGVNPERDVLVTSAGGVSQDWSWASKPKGIWSIAKGYITIPDGYDTMKVYVIANEATDHGDTFYLDSLVAREVTEARLAFSLAELAEAIANTAKANADIAIANFAAILDRWGFTRLSDWIEDVFGVKAIANTAKANADIAIANFITVLNRFGLASVAEWAEDLLSTKTLAGAANSLAAAAKASADQAIANFAAILNRWGFTQLSDWIEDVFGVKAIANTAKANADTAIANFTTILSKWGLSSVADWVNDVWQTRGTANTAKANADIAIGNFTTALNKFGLSTVADWVNDLWGTKGTANTANSTANTAKSNADTALANFQTALTKFGFGSVSAWVDDLFNTKGVASTANSTASNASSVASAASTIANAAKANADEALANFTTALNKFGLSTVADWVNDLWGTKGTAATANTTANTAKTNADTALANFTTALNKFGAASVAAWVDSLWATKGTADTANSTATAANSAASAASSIANAAKTNADQALANFTTALNKFGLSTVSDWVNDLWGTKGTAATANTTANTANTNANTALANFQTALTKFGFGSVSAWVDDLFTTKGTANSANTLAGTANSTANTANSTANAAKTNADQALANFTTALNKFGFGTVSAWVDDLFNTKGVASTANSTANTANTNANTAIANFTAAFTKFGSATITDWVNDLFNTKSTATTANSTANAASNKATTIQSWFTARNRDFQNLVVGSDFDSAVNPWTMVPGLVELDSTVFNSGTKSLKFSTPVSPQVQQHIGYTDSTGALAYFEAKPNEKFYVEIWARRSADWVGDNNGPRFRICRGNGPVAGNTWATGNFVITAAMLPQADTWTKLTFTGSVGDEPGVNTLCFYFGAQPPTGAGTLWVDDIVVRRIPAVDAVPSLPQSKIGNLVSDLLGLTNSSNTANANANTSLAHWQSALTKFGLGSVSAWVDDLFTTKGTASTANTLAGTANSTANTANTNANTALANFTAAFTKFGSSTITDWVNDLFTTKGTANTANSTANTANSTANAANTLAGTANTNANTALGNFTTVLNKFGLGSVSAWADSLWTTKGTADTANSTASTANSTANTANTNANTALANFNTALTKFGFGTVSAWVDDLFNTKGTANTASSTATTANNTANAANTLAGTANTNANTALNNFQTALTKFGFGTVSAWVDDLFNTKGTANTANSTANTANSTANTANTNANTGLANWTTTLSKFGLGSVSSWADDIWNTKGTATTANSTANTANTNANTAITNAATAQSTANTANSTANTANSTANTVTGNLQTTWNNLWDAFNGTTGSTGKTSAQVQVVAGGVRTTANTANTTANTANSTANTANTNANTGLGNWTTALNKFGLGTVAAWADDLWGTKGTATTANSTANTANTNANTAITNIQGTSDNITNAFTGNDGLSGTTLSDALAALKKTYNTLSDHSVAIQSLLAEKQSGSTKGKTISIDFSNYADGPLPSSEFDVTYSGAGTSIVGVVSGVAQWYGGNTANRDAKIINKTSTDTDFQVLRGTMSTPPEQGGSGGTPRFWAIGRVSTDGNSYVWARGYATGLLTYKGDIGCTVNGVETVWASGISLTWSLDMTMVLGVGTNARQYQVFSGTKLVYQHNEVGTVSQLGPNNRRWGAISEIRSAALGSKTGGKLAGASIYDNAVPTINGSYARMSRMTTAATTYPGGGTVTPLAGGFFTNVNYESLDIDGDTSTTTFTIAASASGKPYVISARINLSSNVLAQGTMVLQVRRSGTWVDVYGQQNANNNAESLDGTWIEYLNPGDAVRLATLRGGVNTNAFTGDTAGGMTWFSIAGLG